MMKPLLVAALAIVGLVFSTQDAQAGRRCCRNRCCGFSACNTCNTCNSCSTGCNACANGCSAAPAVNTVAPPPPQQTSNGYQSYSYEPSAPVAVSQSPVISQSTGLPASPNAYLSRPSSFQFRGDRKALGNY